MARPLVVGVGDPSVDIVGRLPPGRELAGSHVMTELTMQGGGRVPLALATAVALGCDARLAGRLGDDPFGTLLRAGLDEDGVDLSFVSTVSGQLSPFRFIALAGADRRAAYATPGDLGATTGPGLDVFAFLEGARVVVLDAHTQGAPLVEVAEAGRAIGAHVIVCASGVAHGLGELLPLASLLLINEGLAGELAPRGELEDSMIELQRMGPQAIVVTRGQAGSLALEGDRLIARPRFVLPAVDPTGSASIFAGALAAALARGHSLEQAVELGTAAGCVSAGSLGGRSSIPEEDDLMALLEWRLGDTA